ncbi:helix-turn-helix domain-containing protein [Devosia aurantiaca]|uniref:helix-turn-helix domain-containing protein n=1 Tax=Devosia aurantiaca TaxID=2714858 RepID=UPI001F31908D|nr:helix-turn-helix domain-containing protein [Devosia aurantiaca]
MTQAELADTLGLSAVHLNRSLQELRGLGLISLRDHRLGVHDLEGLRELASFDPLYLHTHTPGSQEPARLRL